MQANVSIETSLEGISNPSQYRSIQFYMQI